MRHRLHPAAVARTTDEARQGRSELDWAAINDRDRALVATKAILASDEPERSRALSEGFARAYDAYNRRDWELNTLYMDPDDYVFRAADLHEALPDAREEYLGVEGYLEAQALLLESFDELRIELREVLRADRELVIVLMRFSGRGKLSGAPFERNALGEHHFRDGTTLAQVYWWDAARGRRQVGLD